MPVSSSITPPTIVTCLPNLQLIRPRLICPRTSDGLKSRRAALRLNSNNSRVVMNFNSTVTNADDAPCPETSAR
ncbi:hypothetical protein D3C80_2044780 [compost metagenome]